MFIVTLNAASGMPATVAFATADGTATTADGDYVATSGTLTFEPGVTTQLVPVTINGDTKFETDETFLVNLSGASGASISGFQGIGTITNDDVPPSLAINNVSLTEGNAGTSSLVFNVTLSAVSGVRATVAFATADASAATADGDYVATSSTLTFEPGVTTQPVTVAIIGDTKFETDETFVVNLSGANNASIGDSQGQATILNNDVQPSLVINDAWLIEGDAGTSPLVFNVTLSAVSGVQATVAFATADGTATTADGDYVATNGTLTFAPGATTQPVTVWINGDTKFEDHETFLINLSGAMGAAISDPQGIGTMINNDSPPALAINDASLLEGDVGTSNLVFNVSLSAVSGVQAKVTFTTVDGTATTADGDYLATNGTLTFAPGATTHPVTVTINGDTKFENDETFLVSLSGSVGASISDSLGIGTIVNDDARPTLAINNVSLLEGNAGTSNLVFNVTLSAVSGVRATVAYATADNSATTADNDYVATSGTLTFEPGVTTQPITAVVNGDTKFEMDETFRLLLANPTNAMLGSSTATATIDDEDPLPSVVLSLSNPILFENGGSSAVIATLSNASFQDVTVNLAFSGTAMHPGDYSRSTPISIPAGNLTGNIPLTATQDTLDEPNETIVVDIDTVAGGTEQAAQKVTATIVDDDPSLFLATGSDAGMPSRVRTFDPVTSVPRLDFLPYGSGFAGGVRVASGDVNADSTPDIITAPGPGGGPHVRVFDGVTGQQLPQPIGSFFAYGAGFTGGVFVASGDVNGDGFDDVITGAGAGGGPHVRRVQRYDRPAIAPTDRQLLRLWLGLHGRRACRRGRRRRRRKG